MYICEFVFTIIENGGIFYIKLKKKMVQISCTKNRINQKFNYKF